MNPDEKVQDYIGRAEYLYQQLLDIGVTGINESILCSKIVSGLPRRFLNFMSTWSNLEESKQTFVELIARLTAEDGLVNKFRKLKVENALHGEVRFRDKESGRHEDVKKRRKRNFRQRGGKSNSKQKGKCFNCQKEGHWANICPEKKIVKKDGESEKNEEARVTEDLAIIVEEANFVQGSRNWIVDTGATGHMTYDRSDFVTYQDLDRPRHVLFGDKNQGSGIGIGDIKLTTLIGEQCTSLTIKNVLHVPQLRRKLISVSAATDKGCIGEIRMDRIVLKNHLGNVLLVAIKANGLYEAQVEESSDQSYAATDVDTLTLLHGRFGHINKHFIVETSKVVDGLPKLDQQMLKKAPQVGDVVDCHSCRLGKQARVHLPYKDFGQVYSCWRGRPHGYLRGGHAIDIELSILYSL